MSEIWESIYHSNQEMWGSESTSSSVLVKDFFLKKGIKNILIPGFGYGRNAKTFIESGIRVTGIEISKTAIDRAKNTYGINVNVHHGSVSDMPFDNFTYDGIYSYSLIHLLDSEARKKFINDCYNQLALGGYMVFVVVSKEAPSPELFAEGLPQRMRDLHSLDFLSIVERIYLYLPFKAHTIYEIIAAYRQATLHILTVSCNSRTKVQTSNR